MRKDDKRSIRRERMVMVVSSAFVLTALTLAGVYMRNQNKQSQDDGYTIDFEALEERADDKLKEIAQSTPSKEEVAQVPSDDLDYLPMEVGSGDITIPGISDKWGKATADESKSKGMSDGADEKKKTTPKVTAEPVNVGSSNQDREEPMPAALEESVAEETRELHFETSAFARPVSGEVLIPFSMSGSVYFATLDQYKYHPGVVFGAAQGDEVYACAAGKVVSVYNSSEYGHMLVLDLGDGYQAVYGQLDGIAVPVGGYVEAGAKLATIAQPTKYYSVEGNNLYFQLLKNNEPIDPMQYVN